MMSRAIAITVTLATSVAHADPELRAYAEPEQRGYVELAPFLAGLSPEGA